MMIKFESSRTKIELVTLCSPKTAKCRSFRGEVGEVHLTSCPEERVTGIGQLIRPEEKSANEIREAGPARNDDHGVCAMDNYDGIAIVQHQLGDFQKGWLI